MNNQYKSMMEYAVAVKASHPGITDDQLRLALLAKFTENTSLSGSLVGCCAPTPISSLFWLFRIIYHTIKKTFTQDKEKLLTTQDEINKVIAELSVIP